MRLEPVTLAGATVRLIPLTLDHVDALAQVGLEAPLWRWQPAPIADLDGMHAYVCAALADQDRGLVLPFAIVDQASGRIIGSTRYMDIAMAHRRLEIGATWINSAYQRTGANTDAKRLLLTHAFEVLGVQRVVLKTEALNEQSRKAIARLGAVEEGVFRKHLIATSGRARDMVYFSILDTEWPDVKARLYRNRSE
jgi:RimJ/RimL family protein N-acetyltransferase